MASKTPRTDRIDKNYIINGAFDFWQRIFNSTDVNTASYKSDRFFLYTNGGSAGNIKRTQDAPSAEPFLKYCAEFDLTTTTSDGSNRTHRVIQRIESIFARELVGRTASISFWVKSSDFDTVQIELLYANAEDDFSTSTQFATTDVVFTDDGAWQKITYNGISMHASSTNGVEVRVFGKNPSGGGATNFKITGMKLALGSFEQDFSLAGRDWAEELQLCQRYFEKSYLLDVAPGTGGTQYGAIRLTDDDNSAGSGAGLGTIHFATTKRAIPTATIYGYGGTANAVSNNSGSDLAANSGVAQFLGINNISVGNTSGTINTANQYFLCHYAAEAEL